MGLGTKFLLLFMWEPKLKSIQIKIYFLKPTLKPNSQFHLSGIGIATKTKNILNFEMKLKPKVFYHKNKEAPNIGIYLIVKLAKKTPTNYKVKIIAINVGWIIDFL